MMIRAGALFFSTSLLIVAAMITSSSASAPATSALPRNPVDVGVQQRFRAIVYPLHGNVYPFGHYNVTMNIGNPPKPYFLDIDTGSDLSWLNCDAPCVSCQKCPHPFYKPPNNRRVRCKHPFCATLPGHRDCDETPEQCDYEIQYADGFSSLGVLMADDFTLHNNNSHPPYQHIAFGCGYDQQGPGMDKPTPVDGILGLSRGLTSFVSQFKVLGITRNIVGHCLGRRWIGYLFFGDGLIPSNGATWTPMKSIPNMKHQYSPGTASLSIGNKPINANLQIVFDTGSTYTYFPNQPYRALVATLTALLSNSPLNETKDPALPLCWKGPKHFTSLLDVKKYFLSLKLNFAASGKELEIPPENYLIITDLGNACLGILDGTQPTDPSLSNLSLIGDISMQDMMMIFDNEKQQIGWARASPNCDRPPRSANTLLA